MSIDFWPIDGTQHHIIDRKELYTNSKIAHFLDSDTCRIVIAAKGMGKTLLLRSKKKIIEKNPKGAIIIPRGKEYDLPILSGSIPHYGFEDITLWKEIWECAIICSILTHKTVFLQEKIEVEHIWDYIEQLDIDRLFKTKLRSSIIEKKQELPSYFVNEILSRNVKSIQKFTRSFFNLNSLSEKYITNEFFIFIDAFDQTLTDHFPHNLETWKNAQLGLAQASNNLNIQNRHIKVFVSIRQEAYAGFTDDDREVIKGTALLLNYKKQELKDLFLKAIKKYTTHSTIESFCHINSINYEWCNESDNLFDYIYRHSSLTPRSIMYFGKSIDELGLKNIEKDDKEVRFRSEINETGANHIYQDYLLGQKKIFLSSLNSEENIKKLLSLIPSNVLTGKTLLIINSRFSESIGIEKENSHPFCELYNIGLLGTIRQSGFPVRKTQYFRKPYEFDWTQHSFIKDKNVYLIHPSLQDEIWKERSDYYLNPHVIIGESRPWNNGTLFPLIFISHSSKDKSKIEDILPLFEEEINLKVPSNFWYDKWNIPAGGNIYQEVENGVSKADFVIVFISKNSLQSGWVENEWRLKHHNEIESKKIQVIVLIIDDTNPKDLPDFLSKKKALIMSDYDDTQEMLRILSNDISDYLIARNTEIFGDFI